MSTHVNSAEQPSTFAKKKSDEQQKPHRHCCKPSTCGPSDAVNMASTIGFSSSLSRMVTRPAPRFPQFVSLAAPSSCQSRPFSQTVAPRAKGIAQTVTIRPPEGPSTRSRTRELPRESLPQDLGLLPGTFIRPLWRDMPSIFHQPRERLRMEWLSWKSWAQNLTRYVQLPVESPIGQR